MDHKLARDYFTRFYSLTNYMDGYGRNATNCMLNKLMGYIQLTTVNFHFKLPFTIYLMTTNVDEYSFLYNLKYKIKSDNGVF